MLAIYLNGKPTPASLTAGVDYLFTALLDNEAPLQQHWTVSTAAGVLTSADGPFAYSFNSPQTHYIHVSAVGYAGQTEELLISVSVIDKRASAPSLSVAWAKLNWLPNEELRATLTFQDPDGLAPQNVAWVLYRNGLEMNRASGSRLSYPNAVAGTYRLRATAVDAYGNSVTADSAVLVRGGFELQSAIPPLQPGGTLQQIGELFSYELRYGGLTCTALPFPVAALTQEFLLPPGTTHFSFAVDGTPDDEVIVRTNLGNWALVGAPDGLSTEVYDYDYALFGTGAVPAPMDRYVRATIEVLNVHGATVSGGRLRLRVLCWQATPQVYAYTKCPASSYTGGQGARERRLLALFTNIDVQLNVGAVTAPAVKAYRCSDVQQIAATAVVTGAPGVAVPDTGVVYTVSNRAVVYEPVEVGLPELDAHSVYGLPQGRSCQLDLVQYGNPRTEQRVRRAYGKLNVYLAAGAVNAGTQITVTCYTGKYPGYRNFTLTVPSDCYSPDADLYVKIGELAVDAVDYEFERTGFVFDIRLDEGAVQSGSIANYPVAAESPGTLYTHASVFGIVNDGACFTQPVAVSRLTTEVTVGVFSPVSSCSDLACGDQGLYCYAPLVGTGSNVKVAQPLYAPAPFIALQTDQAVCYANPSFIQQITGTAMAGTLPAVFPYTGTTGCGVGYVYDNCNGTGVGLAVIYPLASSPHDFVGYGDYCWEFTGSVADLRPYTVVEAASVTPIVGCSVCSGTDPNGSAVAYLDQETGQTAYVNFPYLETGDSRWGVAGEKFDNGPVGLTDGSTRYTLRNSPLLSVATFSASGTLSFTTSHASFHRRLLRIRNGIGTEFKLSPGVAQTRFGVEPGDVVKLDYYQLSKTLLASPVGFVAWKAIIELPRVYDTVVMQLPAPAILTALGFCGLSQQSDYAFFQPLPSDVTQTLPNPDTFVTVSGTTVASELLLLRTRANGDIAPAVPPYPWYAGQPLAGPVTFKFYASRQIQGQHGEMDVWTSGTNAVWQTEDGASVWQTEDGASAWQLEQAPSAQALWPSYFADGDYRSLGLRQPVHRMTASGSYTSRNSIRVASTGTQRVPRVFTSAAGQRISVVTEGSLFELNGNVFYATGTKDAGISKTVYRGSSVDADYWQTEESGEPWELEAGSGFWQTQ